MKKKKRQGPITTDRVIFFADGHTYWFGAKQLKSVGSFIKPVFPAFREDYWLAHISLKEMFGSEYTDHYNTFPLAQRREGPPAEELFPKFLTQVSAKAFIDKKNEVRARWDLKRFESQFRGTKFHDAREKEAYDRGWIFNRGTGKRVNLSPDVKPVKFYDNESLKMNLYDLADGAYPELLIFDLELGTAGQADMVFIETIDGVRYVDFDDHKTNEDKPAKSGPEKCYAPFDGMYACDHFKYVLQINSYAFLMQKAGFTPRHMAYTHYKDYDINKDTYTPVDNYVNDIGNLARLAPVY